MKNYIIKRVLLIFPMLLGISLVLFVIMHLAPGNPEDARYGLNPEVSSGARLNFISMYDLDKPVFTQYLLWLKRFFKMDFGRSLIDNQPVFSKILSRLPATILLQGISLVIVFLIAVPIGIISAIKRNSLFDRVMTVLVFIGYALPAFWFALILVFVFGFKLEWFPISAMAPWYTVYLDSFGKIKDVIWHLVLPVTAIVVTSLASLCRYTRSSMIEIMEEKYILTARAKGLSEKRVVMVHALRNAFLPIITILGLSLPVLISGSFIFETIFAWPGMGRMGYEAIMNYDYPVVMGVGVMATFLTLIGVFASDVLYAVADPRIRMR